MSGGKKTNKIVQWAWCRNASKWTTATQNQSFILHRDLLCVKSWWHGKYRHIV